MNTGIALVFVLLFSILISSMLAYVLNRFRFPGSGLIHNLFMFASLIPGIATQVTVYQIMFSLGLINHLYGYNPGVVRHRHHLDLHLPAVL